MGDGQECQICRRSQRNCECVNEWKPYHPTEKEIAEAAERRRVGEHSGRDNAWLAQAYLDLIDKQNHE